MRSLFVFTAALLLSFPVLAHDGVMIGNMHTHETVASVDTAAVFASIENHTDVEDAIIAVSTLRAKKAELHTMETDANGVMKMRPVDRFSIPAGQSVELAPGGAHIMLIGVTEPLKVGEEFTITVTFEKDGVHEMPVTVRARDADHSDHESHDAHH